jgi:hypothetical protein
MAPEGRGPALHDGAGGGADVGRQGMGACVLGIARAEDVLQGQKPHGVLQTIDLENAYRLFYNTLERYPRAERLVQRWRSAAPESGSEARADAVGRRLERFVRPDSDAPACCQCRY